MNAEQLRNLINGVQEAPSAHCWNAIQQQLAATVAGGSAAVSASKAAAQTAGKAASVAGKGALSVAKVAAISGSAIVVTTVSIVAVVNLTTPQEPTASATPATTPVTVLTTDTMSTMDTVENPVIASENSNPQTISYKDAIDNSNETPLSTSTTTSSNNAIPTTTTPLSTGTVPLTNTPATLAPLASTTPPSSTSAKENAAVTKPDENKPPIKQIFTTPEKDPVASQYNQEDNPDYRPPVRIEIPNTITPNGDGYNDFFIITGLEQCDDYQLIIFNQARKEIFRTKSYQNNWDASRHDGNTFYYTLIYRLNNIQEKRSGVIYVLR